MIVDFYVIVTAKTREKLEKNGRKNGLYTYENNLIMN
jgi:hypothetical protein